MSEKKTQTGEETARQEAGKTRQAEKSERTRVYCGPSVKGVARQYTVYHGELPAELEEFLREKPEAGGLLVGMDRFAETRKNLGTSGTAEAILYQKIKKEL